MGLPRWHSGKETSCQCRRCGFDTWDTTKQACSVVVCLCFNLYFADEWYGAYFHLVICHLFISLGRCLFRSFAHLKIWLVVFLLLSFKSSLYILDNSLLSAFFFFLNKTRFISSQSLHETLVASQIGLLQTLSLSLWLVFSLSSYCISLLCLLGLF